MNRRVLLGAVGGARHRRAAGRRRARPLNVVTAGDQNMVDYVNNYPRAEVRGAEPGREGARGRHRPRRCRLAEDLREARRAAEGGHRAPGTPTSRSSTSAARRRWSRKICCCRIATTIAAGKLVTRDTAKNALGAERRRLRAADVPQPDRVRLQPRPRQDAAEVLSPSSPTWVKKNPKQFGYNGVKGGMSRRRLRDGLGRAPTAASATSSRRAPTTRPPRPRSKVAREPQGLQPERRDDAGQRRHARHAEPRRDRDGPGVGRHVLHVAGRRQDEPEDQARAAVDRACRASRCTT